MLAITYYLIGNPLIALGLAILILLCFYNVLRRQVRAALAMWLVIICVFVYVYAQSASPVRPLGADPGHADSTATGLRRN